MKTEIINERRTCVQKAVPEKDGNGIEYYIIPNYVKCDDFMTENERNFFLKLVKVVMKMKEKNSSFGYLNISSQVAVNRLIRVNNEREARFEKDIFGKSVDFVIYDVNHNNVICAIELDNKAHEENIDTIERDFRIEKALRQCSIKLVRIPAKGHREYSEKYIVERLKYFNVIDWDWES